MPGPAYVEIENAHHMDEASAELLSSLVPVSATKNGCLGWPGVRHRQVSRRRRPPTSSACELKPLAIPDALRMAELATKDTPLPKHVLEVVAERSGGNPQFLRDLLRFAIQSGGIVGLPDSAEAAALARIDALAPEDRAVVRRAAMFGLNFHPRMLAWFDGDEDPPPPPPETLRAPLGPVRRGRRRLFPVPPIAATGHGVRRAALQASATPARGRGHAHRSGGGPARGTRRHLSLHHAAAGAHEPAWRYSRIAAQRAENAYAFVEAAGLYSRAVEAGSKLPQIDRLEVGRAQEALGDAWRRAGEYQKALDAYIRAKEIVTGERLLEASLLLKFARMEETLGQYSEALRWVERVREALDGLQGIEVDRLNATANVWQATLLQAQGNTAEAMTWAELAAKQGEELDDPVVTAHAYLVLGWGYGVLGKEGAEAMMLKSLEADQRSGNRPRQARRWATWDRSATGMVVSTTRCRTSSVPATSSPRSAASRRRRSRRWASARS